MLRSLARPRRLREKFSREETLPPGQLVRTRRDGTVADGRDAGRAATPVRALERTRAENEGST
jgi:hypothetical protein